MQAPKPSEGFEYVNCKFFPDKPVATFMVSNPRARNAYNVKTWEGMNNAVQTVREDDDIRVLVITGDPEGKTFCAGLNVKGEYRGVARRKGMEVEIPGAPETPEFFPGTAWHKAQMEGAAVMGREIDPESPQFKSMAYAQYKWFQAHTLRGGYWGTRGWDLLKLPKPVIAMVNGMGAWGAGADMAMQCDIICMGDQANLVWNYVHRTGLPLQGAAFWLGHIIGYQRALEIIWRGKPVPAQQADDWGIVNHVWPEAELKDKTYELAMELATEVPPMNLGLNKYHIQLALDDYVHRSELFTDTVTYQMRKIIQESDDALEGPRAFAEKRKPVYKGQ